ncbi:hypothetical protein ACFS07_18235 [Undibacterium arcticum]
MLIDMEVAKATIDQSLVKCRDIGRRRGDSRIKADLQLAIGVIAGKTLVMTR